MTDPLSDAAAGLRDEAARLAAAAARLAALDPGPVVFGVRPGGGGGHLRLLGLAFQHEFELALTARAREAADHAGRLEQVAAAVTRAAGHYAESDHSARRRHPEAP